MASKKNSRSSKLILPWSGVVRSEGAVLAALWRKHINCIHDKVKDSNGELVDYKGPKEIITEDVLRDECIAYIDRLKNDGNNSDASKLTKATLFNNIRSNSLTWKNFLFIMLKIRGVKSLKFTMEVTTGSGIISKHSVTCSGK